MYIYTYMCKSYPEYIIFCGLLESHVVDSCIERNDLLRSLRPLAQQSALYNSSSSKHFCSIAWIFNCNTRYKMTQKCISQETNPRMSICRRLVCPSVWLFLKRQREVTLPCSFRSRRFFPLYPTFTNSFASLAIFRGRTFLLSGLPLFSCFLLQCTWYVHMTDYASDWSLPWFWFNHAFIFNF